MGLRVLHTVRFFRALGRVPRTEIARQISGDPTHTQDILSTADWTFVVDHSFVSALVTGIYRMIDGSVADAFVVHHLDYLGYGPYIFLGFPIEFHVGDVSAPGDGMERSLFADFVHNTDGFFDIYMKRVDVIITVGHSRDHTVFAFVHPGKSSG